MIKKQPVIKKMRNIAARKERRRKPRTSRYVSKREYDRVVSAMVSMQKTIDESTRQIGLLTNYLVELYDHAVKHSLSIDSIMTIMPTLTGKSVAEVCNQYQDAQAEISTTPQYIKLEQAVKRANEILRTHIYEDVDDTGSNALRILADQMTAVTDSEIEEWLRQQEQITENKGGTV